MSIFKETSSWIGAGYTRLKAPWLECFQEKWTPVFRPETRPNKGLGLRFWFNLNACSSVFFGAGIACGCHFAKAAANANLQAGPLNASHNIWMIL